MCIKLTLKLFLMVRTLWFISITDLTENPIKTMFSNGINSSFRINCKPLSDEFNCLETI